VSIAQATITNSTTTVFAPTTGNPEVRSLVFCNIHASTAETLTVYVVPSGSSAGDSTTIIKSLSVPAKRTLIWSFDEPLYLDAGDKIQAVGTTGSLVTATANYVNGAGR
jgi:hypothetical protein